MTSSALWPRLFRVVSMSSSSRSLGQSDLEIASIKALSRERVVEAYALWWDVSEAERACLELTITPNARVLDIGCGTGRHAHWLDGRFSSYLGVDASDPMVKFARKKFPNLAFSVQDALQLDAEEGAFDTILLMGNVLDFFNPKERRSALLERCFRWLQPGGSIVGSSHLTARGVTCGYFPEDYHGAEIYQYRLSASEMVGEAELHGFEIVLFARDFCKKPAHWAYWVGRRPG